MNDRERLVELCDTMTKMCRLQACGFCKYKSLKPSCVSEAIADAMISNGVTVLPVKAGDTIYEIHERRKGGEWVKIISERFVHGVEICASGCMIARCGTTISVFLSDIGKTVFLTREEAEKALKESEDNA